MTKVWTRLVPGQVWFAAEQNTWSLGAKWLRRQPYSSSLQQSPFSDGGGRRGQWGPGAGQSQGTHCQAARLLRFGSVCFPQAQQGNPQLLAVLTWSDRMQAGLYGNSVRSGCWAWVDHMSLSALLGSSPLCPRGVLSCDKSYPLKLKVSRLLGIPWRRSNCQL